MAWMPRTICFVDACYTTPQARCQAARRLGGKPVLEWIVRAATDAQRVDGVVVITSDDPANELVDKIVPPDVPVFRAFGTTPLECFVAGIERFSAEAAVRVAGTWPFVDSVLLDNLVLKAEQVVDADFIGYCGSDNNPAALARIGLLPEWYRGSSLRRAARRLGAGFSGNPAEFIYNFEKRFRIRHLPLPAELDVTELDPLCSPQDAWDMTETIFETLGPDVHNWRRVVRVIIDFCRHHQLHRHSSVKARSLEPE
ncbi:MAG: NTP transferase domain-containing protein [Thermoguttaceae bacterium]|nr:NTP transferase domain-containing protein [Thermoguttaceae bacterium]MDW8078050.1 NTP transferase domain-containing protein [Thermoguttaceae bacterium]